MNNWVLENLLRALAIWAEKMQEIWTLLTTSPQSFRGGTIWSIISGIHGGMKSIAYALLVLFFIVGVARTTTNFNEIKRPEQALKLFIRFAIAKGVVTYSMDILLAIFKIVQGIINSLSGHVGNVLTQGIVLPDIIQQKILACGFFESIPLWIVALISSLLVWILSFVMILTVYSRFFQLYMRSLRRLLKGYSSTTEIESKLYFVSRMRFKGSCKMRKRRNHRNE